MGYINSPASFLVLSAGFCLVMPFFSLSTGISRGETKEGQTLFPSVHHVILWGK